MVGFISSVQKRYLMRTKQQNVEKILNEIYELRRLILLKYPFLYPILRNMRVKVSNEVEIAATNGKYILINGDAWQKMSVKDKIFTLLHETLHVALEHVNKERIKRDRCRWNIACDVVVNELLLRLGLAPPPYVITAEKLRDMFRIKIDKVDKRSAEEIYYMLRRANTICPEGIDKVLDLEEPEREGGGEDSGRDSVGGVSSGDEDFFTNMDDLRRALVLAKSIGTAPADFVIYLDYLTQSKVDWVRLLRVKVISTLSGTPITSWRRPHRKVPDLYPGYIPDVEWYKPREIWVLVDLSGSVVCERETLTQFFSEIYSIARQFRANITVVTWDVEVHDVFTVKSPEDVKERVTYHGVHGGGGTNPTSALKYFIDNVQDNAKVALILLTDGLLEVDEEVVKEAKGKATKAIYAYTIEEHPAFKDWEKVKICL